MKRLARYLMPFAVAAMLGGCNVQESVKQATGEIDGFHHALDAGDWQGVWNSAGPDLHKSTTKEQFGKLLSAVHRKLGTVKATGRAGWSANAGTGGSFVTVINETTFERGTGTEHFVFRKGEHGRLTLADYSIESREMMVE